MEGRSITSDSAQKERDCAVIVNAVSVRAVVLNTAGKAGPVRELEGTVA